MFIIYGIRISNSFNDVIRYRESSDQTVNMAKPVEMVYYHHMALALPHFSAYTGIRTLPLTLVHMWVALGKRALDLCLEI